MMFPTDAAYDEALERAVYAQLSYLARIKPRPPNLNIHDLYIDVVKRFNGAQRGDIWCVVHRLFSEGLLVAGAQDHVWAPGNTLSLNGSELNGLPYFSFTRLGFEVLGSDGEESVALMSPDRYVRRVSETWPDCPPVALSYIAEAALAARHRTYLASVVLLGVAAEGVVQALSMALLKHLRYEAHRSFERSLENAKRSADKAFEVFTSRLLQHLKEDDDDTDLSYRIKTLFVPIQPLLKMTRDDVAHLRANRISYNTAQTSLQGFLSYVEVAAQISEWCTYPCLLAEPSPSPKGLT